MPSAAGRALLLTVTAVVRVGCSSDPSTSRAVFRTQQGVQPNAAARSCQLHQQDAPTSAYRGGTDSVPTLDLPFLAYYTANGDKRYCDGKPPTDTDKEWARLYVRLTGNTAAVRQVLSG